MEASSTSEEESKPGNMSMSPADSGGQCATVTQATEETFPEMPFLERQDSMETVRYSSPVSKSFLEVADLCHSKDVKDPSAIHGCCGLYNLGNTCFMNSGLQSVMASTPLVRFFLEDFVLDDCIKDTLMGKFYRLMCKMWCGQFTVVHPRDFKDSLGLYHSQFQDYRQHDCQEFLALLLDTLHEQLNMIQSNLILPSNNTNKGYVPSSVLEPVTNSLNNRESFSQSVTPDWMKPSSSFAELPMTSSASDQSVSSSNSRTDQQTYVESSMSVNSFDSSISPPGSISSTTVNNFAFVASEDSNHSSVSTHSTNSEQSLCLKKLKLQSIVDSSKTQNRDFAMATVSSSSDISAERKDKLNHKPELSNNVCKKPTLLVGNVSASQLENPKTDNNLVSISASESKSDNLAQLNNSICSSKLPPSLLDFYGKETKTLNTNVLVTEFSKNFVSTDSEKFAKQDNRYRPQQDEVNILQEALGEEDKLNKEDSGNNFGIKDVNLRAEKKSRFLPMSCSNVLNNDCTEEVYGLNNIKRIKIDESESEKNIQIQALSKFNTRKNIDEDQESSGDSMEVEEGDFEEMESSEDEGELTSHSSTVDEVPSVSYHVEDYTEADLIAADRAWESYVNENSSIIVNTFQGQFKSTVVCSECAHVSVTYEPFMYLSLPIPHAMERQICVIFVPQDLPPVRYLLNMNKNDNIQKLKQELLNVIGQKGCDIILAEVLDCHISRILEDNVMLRYVNDSSRKIYAFEMLPPPVTSDDNNCDITQENGVIDDTGVQTTYDNNCDITQENNVIDTGVKKQYSGTVSSTEGFTDEDVFSNMGTFSQNVMEIGMIDSSVDSLYFQHQGVKSTGEIEMQEMHTSSQSESATISVAANVDQSEHSSIVASDMAGTGLWEWTQVGFSDCDHAWDHIDSTTRLTSQVSQPEVSSNVTGIVDQWKSCAICLEELSDNELLIHTSCGGTFCQSCLEMSAKHSGDLTYCCPICLSPASMPDDFVPLACAGTHKPKLRVLAVPIAYRCEVDENGDPKLTMFAHPNILYIPNQISGQCLYMYIDRILPFPLSYTIVLTDGQGLHCSRCMYMAHCTGCEISREGEITLQPGDHLTVDVQSISPEQIVAAQTYHDHKSTENLRPNEPVTIQDCFRAFTESEVLDEHNPWYCSQCQQNQCAKKTMTVWRCPDNLIIHLKRFVFQDLSSTKVDSKVIFPQKNLDLRDFISGPKNRNLNYDLYSIVCHFGGAHSGHYTSYSRHPVTSEWFYYNDDVVSQHAPREDDYSSAYVLLYQRHGTQPEFRPPACLPVTEDETTVTSSPNSMALVLYEPPGSRTDDQEQGQTNSQPPKQAEADSTYDFYS